MPELPALCVSRRQRRVSSVGLCSDELLSQVQELSLLIHEGLFSYTEAVLGEIFMFLLLGGSRLHQSRVLSRELRPMIF